MVTVDRRINGNKVKFEELNPGDAFFRREKYFDGKLYIKLQKNINLLDAVCICDGKLYYLNPFEKFVSKVDCVCEIVR